MLENRRERPITSRLTPDDVTRSNILNSKPNPPEPTRYVNNHYGKVFHKRYLPRG